MKSVHSLLVGSALYGAALGSGASLAADTAIPTPQIAGTWQKHEYTFQFFGFTTTYSCEGLASKLKVLLIAAGARPDARSRPNGCVRGYGQPDKFAQAYLKFYSLVPAVESDAASANVAAVWRPVTLGVRSPRDLARGDCELVEQFNANILPMFTVRNIDNRMTCIPKQESGSVINLKFDSLAAAQAPPNSKH
jgi:hypothetical protein